MSRGNLYYSLRYDERTLDEGMANGSATASDLLIRRNRSMKQSGAVAFSNASNSGAKRSFAIETMSRGGGRGGRESYEADRSAVRSRTGVVKKQSSAFNNNLFNMYRADAVSRTNTNDSI